MNAHTLRRHGVIADPVNLEGETDEVWAVTTPCGGKFFMKRLERRRTRAWRSVEDLRRGKLQEAVVASTSPTRTMELLAEYSSQQGSIVSIHSKEHAMHEETSNQSLSYALANLRQALVRIGKRAEEGALVSEDTAYTDIVSEVHFSVAVVDNLLGQNPEQTTAKAA